MEDGKKPTEVLPWLYLGTKYHSYDSELLKSLDIICVVNVCGGRWALFNPV